MAVKKDYQRDTFKNDFSENEKNELKQKEEKILASYIAPPKYAIEADYDIVCDKDKMTNIEIAKPNDKAMVYAVASSPLLESVGIDHKEIINFENGNVIKLRLTSAASSLSFSIKRGSKLFDLVPIA